MIRPSPRQRPILPWVEGVGVDRKDGGPLAPRMIFWAQARPSRTNGLGRSLHGSRRAHAARNVSYHWSRQQGRGVSSMAWTWQAKCARTCRCYSRCRDFSEEPFEMRCYCRSGPCSELTRRHVLMPGGRSSAHGRSSAQHKDDLVQRAARFHRGEWLGLLAESHFAPCRRGPRGLPSAEDDAKSRRAKAQRQRKVNVGEVSRARQELTAPALAPGTPETLAQLTDPARRPRQPSVPVPADIAEGRSEAALTFDKQLFLANLRLALVSPRRRRRPVWLTSGALTNFARR